MTVPVNRVKTKKPKTRTGCITCRQRRIKCDEAKPNCKRCTSTGRTCGGYTQVQTAAGTTIKELPIRPRQMQADLAPCRVECVHPWYRPLAQLSLKESIAFEFFQQYTAPHLQEYLHSELWQRLVLQLSLHQNVILDAVIALGSLHQANHAKASLVSAQEHRSSLQRFALDHYLRAMSQLRQHMGNAAGDHSENVVLLSCLLFVLFECLQDRQSVAMMHLRNGLGILYDQFKSNLEFATTYHSAVVFKGVRRVVADELISVFSKLDYDAALLNGRRPLLPLLNGQETAANDILLPSQFQSMAEARSYLDLLAFDVAHLQADLFESATRAATTDPNAPTEFGAQQAYIHALTRFVDLGDAESTFNERHTKLKQQITEFGRKMATLLTLSIQHEKPEATVIQLEYTLLHFLITFLRNTHEAECDNFIPIFERAIELAEIHTQESWIETEAPSTQSFSIQTGALRTIYMIAIRCREPGIRRRAINLLLNGAFRERVWDGAAYALLLQRLDRLERGGSTASAAKHNGVSDTGRAPTAMDVPETARFCDALVAGDITEPQAARMVLAKYDHAESATHPKIVIVQDDLMIGQKIAIR